MRTDESIRLVEDVIDLLLFPRDFLSIDEDLITGDSSPREKFQAWAETVPFTLRNPIHHWTHLELRRYFGIDLLLGPDTAEEIWERANAKLQEEEFCVHGILKKFDVRVVGTTDDPADPLDDHAAIAASGLATLVLPTFRPDKAFMVDQPERLKPWLEKLEAASGIHIAHLSDLQRVAGKNASFTIECESGGRAVVACEKKSGGGDERARRDGEGSR